MRAAPSWILGLVPRLEGAFPFGDAPRSGVAAAVELATGGTVAPMAAPGSRVLAIGLVVALAAVGAPAAAPARASSVVPMSHDELFAASDLVALVEVRSASPARVGRRIVTFLDVDVAEVWAFAGEGSAPQEALVAVLGGALDGLEQRVAGMPVLEPGQRYLLFLGKETGPHGARGVVGLWQGAWSIGPDGPHPFMPDGRPSSQRAEVQSFDTWRLRVRAQP